MWVELGLAGTKRGREVGQGGFNLFVFGVKSRRVKFCLPLYKSPLNMCPWKLFMMFFICVFVVDESLAFHGAEVNLICDSCNASFYCTGGVRFLCPSNALASDPNANSIEDCVCQPGFEKVNVEGGHRCVLGLAPYYYYEGIKNECIEHKATVISGAHSEDQCVCMPGYTGENGNRPCTACLPDYYSDIFGAGTCIRCPANSSHSQIAVTNITECECDTGFTGEDGGVCTACPPGSFKHQVGNLQCLVCPPDTFSLVASSACTSCPGNSSSVEGTGSIDGCECDAGYKRAGEECEPCLPGRYKERSGNFACSSCESGFYQDEYAGIACKKCAANATSTPASTKCVCEEGYIQPNSEDVNPTCSACGMGEYQDYQGQTVCKECMEFSSSPPASVAITYCLCEAGFYEEEYQSGTRECLQCVGGTYKVQATTNDQDLHICTSCPVNAHSPVGSSRITDCICDAGHEGIDGGACSPCSPGSFKAVNGSGDCELCAVDFFSNSSASTTCQSCVEFLTSEGGSTSTEGSSSSDDCICSLALGYVEIEQGGVKTCSGCQVGTFAAGGGCQNCTGGQYADVGGLTACRDCPANSSSYDYPHVACQCHAGYFCAPDGKNQSEACPSGNCIACPIDTFKDYTGGATACDVCQNNSVSNLASVSQDDCKCDLGYRQDGPDTCVACLAGRYADTLDSITCTACGDRFYTAQSDFPWTNIGECNQCLICHNDEYDAANQGLGCGNGTATECQACPEHKSLFEAFTSDNWQAGAESCKCDPGYEPVDSSIPSTCKTCALNYFKSSVGDVQCTACPNTTVTEFQGADSLDSCVCPAGYHFDYIDDISCLLCQPGTYKTGLSRQQTCDSCKDHSTSEPGSDDPSDCLCIPGYGDVNGTCEICAVGYQKESTGNEACTECAVNTFAVNLGTPTCEACIPGKSTGGLSAQAYCECEAGSERESGDVLSACRVCEEGKFKPALSYEYPNCTQCALCQADFQVATECNATHDITCISCQTNSWFPTEGSAAHWRNVGDTL